MKLHGGEHRGAGVAHAFTEIGEVGVLGVVAEFPCGGKIAGAECFTGLVLQAGAEFRLQRGPPDGAVQKNAEGEQKAGEDGPHDPAAFNEFFDDDVGEHDWFISV